MNENPPNRPENPAEPMRLQVYLAHAGAASRRAAEKLISAGRVSVNGAVVSVLGVKVLPQDEVCLDGVPVHLESRLQYLVLHKPPEYLCSMADPQGRPLARELLPKEIQERLYTVGRLDYRSSGLILFTNDGTFAAYVGHPSRCVPKEYLVEASGIIPPVVAEAFVQGIVIEGISYRAESIERLGKKTLRIVLIEGKNREIRRVFSYFHLHPVNLCRIRIGPVCLGDLPVGASRPLTRVEYTGLMGNPC
ncbi:MAG: rRNA pseudouridine synthase [Spirochaetaceae bacterium]|nr:rRNA pseudouridine synthase [Spirochaetaceae bacterium]